MHLAGYTYRADNYCPKCATYELVTDRLFDIGLPADAEELSCSDPDTMGFVAEQLGIDEDDPSSFDSDYFPKAFTSSQVEGDEKCGKCNVEL